MLYLIGVNHKPNKKIDYTVFETKTESTIIEDNDTIIKLVKELGLGARNFDVKDNKIQARNWPHPLCGSEDRGNCVHPAYTLLTKINEDKYKLVTIFGDIVYYNEREFKTQIRRSNIVNCAYINNSRDEGYESIDTYNTAEDKKSEQVIKDKYEKFRAKALLTGLDINFDYIIEGQEVKLIKYTGKSTRVIIPPFIDTICARAFRYVPGSKNSKIDEVQFNEGLRFIGMQAFEDNSIKNIVLPKSLQLIYKDAFGHNSNGDIYAEDCESDTSPVKILNKDTKIL